MYHSPVLLPQILNLLQPEPGKIFVDATVGNGGHTIELIKRGADVYGIDQDPTNLEITQKRLKDLGLISHFHPIRANFTSLTAIIQSHISVRVFGVLFDLGLSLNQQTNRGRGFSFNDPDSLDMRLNPNLPSPTAKTIINTYSFENLYQIFTKYAQEKYSKPLIYQIINHRQKKPFTTALELAGIIRQYYQKHRLTTPIDPATKIFLALRIAVNNEIDNLKQVLAQTLTLPPGAILCFITFNSTEDRLVKRFIQTHPNYLKTPLPQVITPPPTEIQSNPLSRSAKLRSFIIK